MVQTPDMAVTVIRMNMCREDSGLLTDKTHLPVKQLRFGDTAGGSDQGYHTLGKLKCYDIV